MSHSAPKTRSAIASAAAANQAMGQSLDKPNEPQIKTNGAGIAPVTVDHSGDSTDTNSSSPSTPTNESDGVAVLAALVPEAAGGKRKASITNATTAATVAKEKPPSSNIPVFGGKLPAPLQPPPGTILQTPWKLPQPTSLQQGGVLPGGPNQNVLKFDLSQPPHHLIQASQMSAGMAAALRDYHTIMEQQANGTLPTAINPSLPMPLLPPNGMPPSMPMGGMPFEHLPGVQSLPVEYIPNMFLDPRFGPTVKALTHPPSLCCHQCKTSKSLHNFALCTTPARNDRKAACRKKYCETCLRRSYDIHITKWKESDRLFWMCPACEGRCTCAACHRHRAGAQLKNSTEKASEEQAKVSTSVQALEQLAKLGKKSTKSQRDRELKRADRLAGRARDVDDEEKENDYDPADYPIATATVVSSPSGTGIAVATAVSPTTPNSQLTSSTGGGSGSGGSRAMATTNYALAYPPKGGEEEAKEGGSKKRKHITTGPELTAPDDETNENDPDHLAYVSLLLVAQQEQPPSLDTKMSDADADEHEPSVKIEEETTSTTEQGSSPRKKHKKKHKKGHHSPPALAVQVKETNTTVAASRSPDVPMADDDSVSTPSSIGSSPEPGDLPRLESQQQQLQQQSSSQPHHPSLFVPTSGSLSPPSSLSTLSNAVSATKNGLLGTGDPRTISIPSLTKSPKIQQPQQPPLPLARVANNNGKPLNPNWLPPPTMPPNAPYIPGVPVQYYPYAPGMPPPPPHAEFHYPYGPPPINYMPPGSTPPGMVVLPPPIEPTAGDLVSDFEMKAIKHLTECGVTPDELQHYSVYACQFCGVDALFIEVALESLPKRGSDRSRVIDKKKHLFYFPYDVVNEPVPVQHTPQWVEKQFHCCCPTCKTALAFTVEVTSQKDNVYIKEDTLIQKTQHQQRPTRTSVVNTARPVPIVAHK